MKKFELLVGLVATVFVSWLRGSGLNSCESSKNNGVYPLPEEKLEATIGSELGLWMLEQRWPEFRVLITRYPAEK